MAPSYHHPVQYVRTSVFHPFGLPLFVVSVLVGCIAQSVGLVAVLLAIYLLGAIFVSRQERFRRWAHKKWERAATTAIEERQDSEVLLASIDDHNMFLKLRSAMKETEAHDPWLARQFELNDWLNRFVELAVAHQKCRLSRLSQAQEELSMLVAGDAQGHPWRTCSLRRRSVLARRAELWDRFENRAATMREELECISEFIELICDWAAIPPEKESMGERLEDLLIDFDELEVGKQGTHEREREGKLLGKGSTRVGPLRSEIDHRLDDDRAAHQAVLVSLAER
jgi:hypothetical protein